MKKGIFLFKCASWLLMANGIIHISVLQIPFESDIQAEMDFYNKLGSYVLPSFGRTFYELDLGVSYGTALTTILVAIMNLFMINGIPFEKLRSLLIINLVGWSIIWLVFLRYTLLPPVVLWGMVVLLMAFALILINRKTAGTVFHEP